MKNTLNEFANLETNKRVNWLRFFMMVVVIVAVVKLEYHIEYYGIDGFLLILLMVIICWQYKIEYSKKFHFGKRHILVSVKRNMFGFYFISIMDDMLLVRQVRTRKSEFEFIENRLALTVRLNLPKDGLPNCEVKISDG
ncbi:hypothetical protein [Thalassomonas actiniarum]|uniref:Uncharacterized protein n=1 Tax=Thalassomonas actiniarum TaxID=485447 RepID=A0AAE9YT59_9GAMM|nr:hypothetical protein [Thalassomonas actiniarum]WDE00760.1 hypothetical protein SG35_009070 [Thalassomonas actiniarum]